MMARYDPQKTRGRRRLSDDEPAPVDALLSPAAPAASPERVTERPAEAPVRQVDPEASPAAELPPETAGSPETAAEAGAPVVIPPPTEPAIEPAAPQGRRARRVGGARCGASVGLVVAPPPLRLRSRSH